VASRLDQRSGEEHEMPEDDAQDRPDAARAQTFDIAGGHFVVLDPAGLLSAPPPAFEPILHPAAFPAPLNEIGLELAGGERDGPAKIRLRATLDVAANPFEGLLHPGSVGTDYVAPLVDAVSKIFGSEGFTGGRATGPQANGWGRLFEPRQDARPAPGSTSTRRDEASGVEAILTYGRPSSPWQVVHTLQTSIDPEATPDPAKIAGFLRLVVDVARQQAGRASDEEFLTGRTFTISRRPPPRPAARPKPQAQKQGQASGSGTDGPPVAPTDETGSAVRLDQLGGLDDVVSQLRDVADSFRHPEVMARWGARRPQGILMSGPPGTGKTTLAKALATEIGASLKEIRTPDILQKWVGQSERNIKKIFTEARGYRSPTVLLFDEFDSIISYTGTPHGSADQALNSVAGIFKQELNTLVEENPNVIVVATTNFPERVDASLVRSGRFDLKLSIPLPDAAGRAEILSKLILRLIDRHRTAEFAMFGELDTERLAVLTDGLSGADLQEILRRVQMLKAMQEVRGDAAATMITQADLELAISQLRRG
jgi:transitional endoplasmic reticulum ATPase